MRVAALLIAMSAQGLAQAQEAPYCVATDAGQMCIYYVVSLCQADARQAGGVCVANTASNARPAPQGHNPPALLLPDIAGSMQRGAEQGQRMRIEREEHEARMSLMDAQAKAYQRRAELDDVELQPSSLYKVTYDCISDSGSHYTAKIPVPGCVVVSIDFHVD